MSSLQPTTPPALDRIVQRCLAKDPDDRWQTARDLCVGLKWTSDSSSQATTAPLPVGAWSRLGTWLFTAGALVAVAALAGFVVWNMKSAPAVAPRPVTRSVISLPAGQRLQTSSGRTPLTLSPDGSLLAYTAVLGDSPQIYLRAMDSLEARAIVGTEGGGGPFFSPDGQWLGFFTGGTLKKVSVKDGGPAITVADGTQTPLGASWSDQGSIVLGTVQPYPGPGGKWQISTDGGTEPAWNRNGQEMFFRSGNRMMAVEVTTQPAFSAGKPNVLFEGSFVKSEFPLIGLAYDVSPDGKRFLMVKQIAEAASSSQIVVVQNWTEELKRRVPNGKN